MLGRLKGKLLEKHPPDLLIDVGGVAFELQASMQTFYQLPSVEEVVILHTHLVVREDVLQLYAFYMQSERTLFRALLKVNGVGPKLALTILSSISPEEFVRYVTEQNAAALVRIPGIGRKTAERLMIEMRDRLDGWENTESFTLPDTMNVAKNNTQQDAISALVALGYKPQEAARAVQQIYQTELSSEELIRSALKRINT